SASVAMDVQELHPSVLESVGDHRQELHQEVIAERRVGGEGISGRGGVDGDDLRGLARPGIEPPPVGGNEPRPPEDLPLFDRLDRDPGPVAAPDLERDLPLEHEEELLGGLPLMHQHLADVVGPFLGLRDHRMDESRVDVDEERVAQDAVGDGFACGCGHFFPSEVAGADGTVRIAATSSVRSIPTGHQVMQRPQPTHPEVPNWSCQLASLWVSHWRYRERFVFRTAWPCISVSPRLKQESQRRQRSTFSTARSGTSSWLLQKHVGQTIVQLVHERHRRATISHRGCSRFLSSRSWIPSVSSARPIEAAARETIASAFAGSSGAAALSGTSDRTAAPSLEPTWTRK